MKKESLKEKAYSFIRTKIISCEYMPNMFLNEEILRNEVNVSRTPIRDALSRLEQENLVKIIPKKGIMVSEVSINEINMIYETRMLIEPYILEKYGQNLNDKELLKTKKAFNNQAVTEKIEEIYKIDDDFHKMIAESSNNNYLIQTLNSTYSQNYRLRILCGRKVDKRLQDSKKEHIAIIDLILDRKFEKASQIMSEHLEKSKDAAFSLLIENGGWLRK